MPLPKVHKITVCTIPGCERPHFTRGWCRAHYKRWHRYGTPFGQPEQACMKARERKARSVWQSKADRSYERNPNSFACSIPMCLKGKNPGERYCRKHAEMIERRGHPLPLPLGGVSGPTCRRAGCNGTSDTRGLCTPCRQTWYARLTEKFTRDGHAHVPPKNPRGFCSTDRCFRTAVSKQGLCSTCQKAEYTRRTMTKPKPVKVPVVDIAELTSEPSARSDKYCTQPGCSQRYYRGGFCRSCFDTVMRGETPVA